MEETKTSKPNSILSNFKALRKPYQIAIILGVLAAVVLLFFVLKPSTPFDKINDSMTQEDARRVFGSLRKESFGEYNVPYQWAGINGTLKLGFWWKPGVLEKDNSAETTCNYAAWHVSASDPSLCKAKFSRILSRNYKKTGEDTWEDKDGNRITIGVIYGSEVWVEYRLD